MKNKPIFPKHWGNEPLIQTRDRIKLPAPYENFYGSSSLASWIKINQKKDETN